MPLTANEIRSKYELPTRRGVRISLSPDEIRDKFGLKNFGGQGTGGATEQLKQGNIERQISAGAMNSILGNALVLAGAVPELPEGFQEDAPKNIGETLLRSGGALLPDLPAFAAFGGLARAAGPVLSTGAAFGGPGLLREATAQQRHEGKIDPFRVAKEGAKEAALGVAIGGVGKLIPGVSKAARVGRFGAEVGVFSEFQALEEGNITPSTDQIAISALFLGGLKGFNAALGYAARKSGVTTQEMKQRVGNDKEALAKEIQGIKDIGGKSPLQERISERGTLYHATSGGKANEILESGKIRATPGGGISELPGGVSVSRTAAGAIQGGTAEGRVPNVVFELKLTKGRPVKDARLNPAARQRQIEAEERIPQDIPISQIKTIFAHTEFMPANLARLAKEKGIPVRPLSEAGVARLTGIKDFEARQKDLNRTANPRETAAIQRDMKDMADKVTAESQKAMEKTIEPKAEKFQPKVAEIVRRLKAARERLRACKD